MTKSDLAKKLDELVAAVGRYPDGATWIQAGVGIKPTPTIRSLQRWLGMLVTQNRIVRVGGTHTTRYKLPDDSELANVPYMSVVGQSVWRLVNQPLAERAPADYRRLAMDGYQPNQSFYVSEQVRTPLRAPVGAGATPAWRDPAVYSALLSDLAWRSAWLEVQDSATPIEPLGHPDVTAWLAQPEPVHALPQVRLVWNHRAALDVLLGRAPNVALTYELLAAMYTALSKGLVRLPPVLVRNKPLPMAPLLRTEPIQLARTSYRAPGDPAVIATCFNQILGWAPAIADPVEQAFFVFVHLLYLQPFATLNWSMACLAVNIPLLRAGLPPVTLALVRGNDIVDGVRGVWELNRTELLRDVFVAACSFSRESYVSAPANAASSAIPG